MEHCCTFSNRVCAEKDDWGLLNGFSLVYKISLAMVQAIYIIITIAAIVILTCGRLKGGSVDSHGPPALT